jgi:hypothetical protein
MGLKFLIIGGKGFVFDHAHLHLRECSQKVAAYREFASVHRVVGANPEIAYLGDVKMLECMARKINSTWPRGNDLVARSMQDAFYIILNKLEAHDETYYL